MDGYHLREGGDIKSILKNFASENKFDEFFLDYSLVSYSTYFIGNNGIKKAIDNKKINHYMNVACSIKQDYKISIFRKKSPFYPILITLHTNETNTNLKAHIYTQRIPKNANLEELIKMTILNICAYRGIIIGLGWNNLDISDVALKLRDNESHPEYYVIDISNLEEPKASSIAIELLLSKNDTVSTLSHDSPLRGGGFFKVDTGEILLDYTKPKYYSPWRDIYGNIYGIGTMYPVSTKAGDGIEAIEVGNKILYKAIKSGYVSIVKNIMIISDVVVLDGVNQDNADNIMKQKLDTLIVENDNLTKDVVSSNVELNIDKLKIIGNVGAANIISKELIIKGQVHIKSNIKSIRSSILSFRGNLESRYAKIRYCEHGCIKSDDIFINFLNGSTIYCSKGRISHIKSNNIIYVQDSLLIGDMTGKNNEFILNPCLYGDSKIELENLRNKIANLNRLKNIFMIDGQTIKDNQLKNELLYKELLDKDITSINSNLYDWDTNVLNKHHLQYERYNNILSKYELLIENLEKDINNIRLLVKDRLNFMFNIHLTFHRRCHTDFYIRYIDFYGNESRVHVNGRLNYSIKKVMLSKEDDSDKIKVVCFKD